jgi:hypothetical protein
MSNNLKVGDLATVIEGRGGANHVRSAPVKVDNCGNCIGSIPEHAVLEILPKPDSWAGAYPHKAGNRVWWYVRGRTNKYLATDRFEVVEGWSAAAENGVAYLEPLEPVPGCHDTMGTSLDTHLGPTSRAYVLPPDGLNVRKEADPHAAWVELLAQGTVVTVTGDPECGNKMVWWQVQREGAARPIGWASEDSGLLSTIHEWYLAPLTLE